MSPVFAFFTFLPLNEIPLFFLVFTLFYFVLFRIANFFLHRHSFDTVEMMCIRMRSLVGWLVGICISVSLLQFCKSKSKTHVSLMYLQLSLLHADCTPNIFILFKIAHMEYFPLFCNIFNGIFSDRLLWCDCLSVHLFVV